MFWRGHHTVPHQICEWSFFGFVPRPSIGLSHKLEKSRAQFSKLQHILEPHFTLGLCASQGYWGFRNLYPRPCSDNSSTLPRSTILWFAASRNLCDANSDHGALARKPCSKHGEACEVS